jgi:hypothetical protein
VRFTLRDPLGRDALGVTSVGCDEVSQSAANGWWAADLCTRKQSVNQAPALRQVALGAPSLVTAVSVSALGDAGVEAAKRMRIGPTTGLARYVRVGRLVRATLLSAALAVVVSPFAHPAIARADFNRDFDDFCIKNLGQGNDYCCAHAGGVVKGGGCVDPVTGNVFSSAVTRG